MLVLIFGLVPGIILRTGIIHAYESLAMDEKTNSIISQADLLATQIVANNYIENPAMSKNTDVQLEQYASLMKGRILIIDKAFHVMKDTYKADVGRTVLSKNVINAYRGNSAVYISPDRRLLSLSELKIQLI